MAKKKADSYVEPKNRKLIYKNKTKNPILLFWNWGWNIYYDNPEIWNVMVDELLATPNDPVRQGSLTGRMTEPLFTGRVFGKTGTLTTVGVSSLSGYCLSDGGRWYAFSVISEDTPVAESRLLQDALCKVLVLTRDDEP